MSGGIMYHRLNGVSIPYLLGLDDTPTLVNPRGTIPANWMQELFSISHKKSELLQEYMELDKREKAILKQIMENLNAPCSIRFTTTSG